MKKISKILEESRKNRLAKERCLTVGDLKEFLKDKPNNIEIGIGWEGKISPLTNRFYWEEPVDLPFKVLLCKSFFD